MPKRDTRCLMPRFTNGNILKASIQFRSEKRNGSTCKCAVLVVAGRRLVNDETMLYSIYTLYQTQFSYYDDDYDNCLSINKFNSAFTPVKC